jgi:hypothetical protein
LWRQRNKGRNETHLKLDEDRLSKLGLLLNYIEEGHRDTGRPKTRWKDELNRRRNSPEKSAIEAEDLGSCLLV